MKNTEFQKKILEITGDQNEKITAIEKRIAGIFLAMEERLSILSAKTYEIETRAEMGSNSCKVDATFVTENALNPKEVERRQKEISYYLNALMNQYQASHIEARQLKVHKQNNITITINGTGK